MAQTLTITVTVCSTMIVANAPLLTLYRVKTITSPFHPPYHYCALDSHTVCVSTRFPPSPPSPSP